MVAATEIERTIAQQRRASANLALLGDKLILWNAERTAFLMYAVQGRSVVALGDPVGPPDAAPHLIARFIAMCDRTTLTPVFYEVSRAHLEVYGRFGLSTVQIGEEARVQLADFSLTGSAVKPLRNAVTRLTRERCAFRIADHGEVSLLVPQLRDISDDWLERKGVSEKGFSVGFFTPAYVRRFPAALVTCAGRLVAFATLWTTSTEVAPDLMRYRGDAPPGTMDALFAQVMLWARDRGYTSCNLGMAPLAGLPSSEGSAWTRLAHFIYEHGEPFYNFRGIRSYKEKFRPAWEPSYLVSPGGAARARALADIAALVAGGYRGIFMRARRRVA